MEKTLHVAIDGGGTKIIGILFLSDGTILKSKRLAMNSNIGFGAELKALQVLENGIETLLKELCQEHEWEKVQTITFTIANHDDRMLDYFNEKYPTKKFFLMDDGIPAFAACFGNGKGICIASGTGALINYCKTPIFSLDRKDYAFVGAWGRLDDDPGSGYYVGINALRVLFRDCERKVCSTLGKAVADKLNVDFDDRTAVEKAVYTQLTHRDIAQLSQVVANCAREGDEKAIEIYDNCAYRLAEFCRELYNVANVQGKCAVALVGGMRKSGDILLTPLKKHLTALSENLVYAEPLFQNYIGSILCAFRFMGFDITDEIIENLQKTKHIAE